MADVPVLSPAAGKRGWRPRLAAWLLGAVAILLLAGYLVAGSPAFFKAVILPRIAKALDADVTLGSVAISPFHRLVLRNLRLRPAGGGRSFAIPELRARYSLLDLLRGKIFLELAANDPACPGDSPEATLQLEAGFRNKVLELHQCRLAFRPTGRDPNQAQFAGTIDFRDPSGTRGHLSLTAESLDLTRCYNLFVRSEPPAPSLRAAQNPPIQASPSPKPEPGPRRLPFRDFQASVDIRRLRLGELEVSDWKAAATLDGGRVVLKPLRLLLNGAPLEATLDLDLGVAGFTYALALDAQRIPLAPLVNTLEPHWNGTLNGTLTAHAEVRGAGLTGAGLKRNLTGQFNLVSTNLDLSVASIPEDSLSTRLLKTLMSAIALIPEFTRTMADPAASPDKQPGPATPAAPAVELGKSPINAITLHGTAGSGRLELAQTVVQGPAFEARASGTVRFDDILTNSPVQIPVAVFLEPGIARKLKFGDAGAPGGGGYVRLPDFLTLKGTLGKPSSHVDTKKLTSSCKQS